MRALNRATAIVAAALGVLACSGSNGGEVGTDTPCELLRPSDASDLLGGEVEVIGWTDFVESVRDEPLSAEERDGQQSVADKICVYKLTGGSAAVTLQVDKGQFPSEEFFRDAWREQSEILDSPGLASAYEATDRGEAISVLLNDSGDGLALQTHRDAVHREELIALAADLTARYGPRADR